MSFSPDTLNDNIGGFFRLDSCPTGKDIGGGIAVLRPGVQGNMGLGRQGDDK